MSSQRRAHRKFSDEEIEEIAARDEVIPPISPQELRDAVAVSAAGRTKVPISIRLDEDVLASCKAHGPGYQTRINDLLAAHARGELIGPLPRDVADAFAPDIPGFQDRIVSALREWLSVHA